MSTRRKLEMLAFSSLALASCGSEPTGQSVAVVNGEEIVVGELNAELSTANVPATADKKAVMPLLLQNVIDRRLLAQKASEQGIDKTPEFVTRQRRLNEDLLIGMSSKRKADSIRLPDQRTVDAYIAANPAMFTQRTRLNLDQMHFVAPADAEQIERLRQARSIDRLAAALTQMGIEFVRADAKLDTATVPPAVLKQIFALPAGEPFIVPIQGRMYASVITGREPVTAGEDENRRIAVEAIRRETLLNAMKKELKDLRSAAKIEYQAGYAPTKAGGVKVGDKAASQ